MKYSELLIPTVKEVPAEAEIISHQLMIRAGLVRKVASGTYTYLPLGWKILRKVMEIVRQEMNAAGGQEILMPILQPMELWQRTGRDVDYGPTMFKLADRKDAMNVLAPTAEEVVTSMMAGEVNSYKQLPVCLYQISPKFRDELRPRFGVLRSREFMMKDAYSFHADVASLEETYKKMYDAYCRVFTRCGLDYVIVEAESGPIGGSASHEFMVPCQAGEDIIVHTEDGSYAANIEKAEVDPIQRTSLPSACGLASVEEVHTPNVGSIEAVCNFLGTTPPQMIKTLVYAATFAGAKAPVAMVCLIRGDHELNENKVMHATGAAHVALADEAMIRKVTGAAVGFAGPVGIASRVGKLLIDHAVAAMASGVTGANKTDYHVKNVVPGRDFPLEGENVIVADIRNAAEGDTHGGKPLKFSRGIEIGHVFKLGTKYSDKLGAIFQDEKGLKQPCMMGCYGIGINRILASAIESDKGHDANGCILPAAIAPFEVEIVPLNLDKEPVAAEANRIYAELTAAGVDVLLDDRDERAGVKFKDADLLGIPMRVVVGEKGLKEGKVEFKRRTDAKPTLVATGEVVAMIAKALGETRQN